MAEIVKQYIMKDMSATEFLTISLQKLDEITIETEQELLLLDKNLYKYGNISKDFKMRLLPPQLQEKFRQRMNEIKLDQNNFTNSLKPYEKGKGPYTKSKAADIPLTLPPALEEAVPKPPPEVPYKPDALPEKATIPTGSDKRQPAPRRPVEKGGMTPKRKRSQSSSGSSSSSDSDDKDNLQTKISKLQKTIERLNAAKGSEQRDINPAGRDPSKFQFSLKKPESGRTVLMPTKEDSYFERSGGSREPREPRSERGERDLDLREPRSEREYRQGPDMYSPQRDDGRSKPQYRSKSYRPPYPFKR